MTATEPEQHPVDDTDDTDDTDDKHHEPAPAAAPRARDAGPQSRIQAEPARPTTTRTTPRRKVSKSPVLVLVGAVCVYEATAETVNAVLDVDVLPSAVTLVKRFSWKALGRRIAPPPWAGTVTIGAMGFGYAMLTQARRSGRKRS